MTWRTIIPGVASLVVNGNLICSVVREAPGAYQFESYGYRDSHSYRTLRAAQTAAINHFKQAGIL